MRFVLLSIAVLAASASLAAERAVIQQMKGRRAIVQFERDIPFSVGQKVHLNSEDGVELGVRSDIRNPLERKNSIQLASSYTITDTEPKETTAYSVGVRYGWNMERYEFGPLGEFSFTKSSGEISRTEFGGFFDFNMIPNKPGEDIIWGFFGEASLGSSKVSTSNKGLTVLTAGGFLKWFMLSPVLAFRANAFYSNEKQANIEARNTTGVSLGIDHYF